MAYFYRTVFLGADLALFLPDPNWRWALKVIHRKETIVDSGQTDRENRRARRYSMLHELAATWTLGQQATAELEAHLFTLSVPVNGDRVFVGMPMFMDQLPKARWGEKIYAAQWVINYDETGYAIYAANAVPDVPVRRWLAPLMVGRLQERPKVIARNKGESQVAMRLLERSPWDLRLAPAPEGVVSANFPEALLDLANWKELPTSMTDEVMVYEEIGDGRMEAADGQEGTMRRSQQFLVTLSTRAQIRLLLNFFAARKGRVQSFDAPWLLQPGEDVAETPHTVRARFTEDALELTYSSDAIATAKLGFTQVPWEAAGVEGEVPEQAEEAYFYRLTMDVPGGPLQWRYTNWETNLVRAGDGTYLGDVKSMWEHDRTTQTIDLSDEPTNLVSWIFEDNPLIRVVQRLVDLPIEIEIFKGDPANPNDAALIYAGNVDQVSLESRKITATTQVLGGMAQVKVPSFYFGPDCNYEFCGAGCTLDPADWTFAATVTSQVGNELTLAVTSNPPAAALTDDWFAGGWISKGAGATYELKQIVRSENLGGANQKFLLQRPFRAIADGDVLTFMPHCTGTKEECQDIFDNYINFGGHPFIGARNLSIPQREAAAGGGKK